MEPNTVRRGMLAALIIGATGLVTATALARPAPAPGTSFPGGGWSRAHAESLAARLASPGD